MIALPPGLVDSVGSACIEVTAADHDQRCSVIIPIDHPLGDGIIDRIRVGEPCLQAHALTLLLGSGLCALQKAGGVAHNTGISRVPTKPSAVYPSVTAA